MPQPSSGIDDPTGGERRDRRLRRVGSTTRWLTAAAVAGTAALGVAYTQLASGATTSQPPAPPASPGVQSTGGYLPGDDDDRAEDEDGDHEDGEEDEDGEEHEEDEEDEEDEDGGRSRLFRPAPPPGPAQQPPQTNTGGS